MVHPRCSHWTLKRNYITVGCFWNFSCFNQTQALKIDYVNKYRKASSKQWKSYTEDENEKIIWFDKIVSYLENENEIKQVGNQNINFKLWCNYQNIWFRPPRAIILWLWDTKLKSIIQRKFIHLISWGIWSYIGTVLVQN